MNSSLLIYNDTSTLTLRVSDYFYVYALPIICLFGTITNLLNLIVFIRLERANHKKMNGTTKKRSNFYKYMIANSFLDILYELAALFLLISRCGIVCSLGFKFESKFYELYIYNFLSNCFLMVTVLNDITLSVDRLASLLNLSRLRDDKLPFYIKLVLFMASSLVALYFSIVFLRQIKIIGLIRINDHEYDSLYSIVNSWSPDQTSMIVEIITYLALARELFFLVVLLIANLIIGVLFKIHLKTKLRLTNGSSNNITPIGESSLQQATSNASSTVNGVEKKSQSNKASENKATKLIMVMSFFYLVGNLPHSISPILFYAKLPALSYNIFILFANGLIYFSHGLNIVIFYYFNLEFATELKNIFINSSN